MEEIKFSFFNGNVNNVYPSGKVSLKRFVKAQKSPTEKMKTIFNAIAACEERGDLKAKYEIKKNNLFYFTPCVELTSRSYSGIVRFTGFMVLDFDHIPNAEKFRDFLFERYKFIICAYTSPSRAGVKAIVKIPIVHSIDEFKSFFHGLCYYFVRFEGFDTSAQNPTLPLFISWDENLRYRDNPTTWNGIGEQVNAVKEFVGEIVQVDRSDEDIEHIYNIAKSALYKANTDENGHPKVVGTATSLGGYVAAGYLSIQEAENIMFELISEVDYLSKNISGYRKTATEMINRGTSSPLYLKKD